ncbi:VOC family protein [Paenibacillus sp. PR3]|uniref:VOC family protein n=1 Tax=Paenibacillus terricola TaxID=2763503 RepID=A0ABR8N7B2_9BACL|nr:VOC family protein [Paenibacillus terricola]MBD3922339.1 VOC family protein [Paenibacillus terricola]
MLKRIKMIINYWKWSCSILIKSSYLDIMTLDFERSIKWYQDNLDCTVSVNNGIDFAMLEFSGNPMFIYKLEQINRNYLPNGEPFYDAGFIVDIDDLDKLHQKLKNNGNEVTDLEIEEEDGKPWAFYVNDPDGNRICFWRG